MKGLVIACFLVFTVLQLQAQDGNVQVFKVSKQVITEPEDIGIRIFNLYKDESFETLIAEFLPDSITFLGILDSLGVGSDSEMRKYKNFNEIRQIYLDHFKADVKALKEHGLLSMKDAKILSKDSITYTYKKVDLYSNGMLTNLLYIVVPCYTSNGFYDFKIGSLFYHKGRWYLFETPIWFYDIEK